MKPPWHKSELFWQDFFEQAEGRRQPGSGNQPGRPGDVRYKERINLSIAGLALLEAKQTSKKYLTIHGEWLAKISLEAAQLGRTPLLGLTIGEEQWLAIPAWAIEQKGNGYGAGDGGLFGDDGAGNSRTESGDHPADS